MSFNAVAWAVRQKLPSTQKLVLIMLAERHNKDTGQCNPSHELLADDCGLSRRSVMDQVSKLADAGYIRILHRAKDNVKLPNQYVLNLHFGIPEQVKTMEDDPYLVVNDVHQGSERASPRVVNDVPGVVNVLHEGSEPAAHKPVNEPVIEPIKKKARASAHAIPRPDDVTDQTWTDWVALRRDKRATVSQTVIDGARNEALKAGLTLEAFLKIWCLRGSQGLQADWLKPAELQQYRSAGYPPAVKHAGAGSAIFDGVWE